MSYQNQSFGMMDQGYFVPRGEILTWLNDLLKLNLTKIQQLGSGAVYCQVVDVIHPGKVGLAKVNWKARNDYQFIANLKILQNAFDKIGIKRHVEVQKLAKAKYQDNLEFIQWLKRYYDLNCGERGASYQAEERRGNAVVDLSFADKTVVPKTYNGSGAVKPPSTQIPQKTQKVQKKKPEPKKQQAPLTTVTRVKSPTQSKRSEVKATQSAKKQQTKTSTKTIPKTQAKTEQQGQTQAHKQIVIQYRTDPKLQAQLEQAFADLEQAKAESASHQQKAKNAEMKLEMVKQILKSEDDPTMKVTMIEEILKQ